METFKFEKVFSLSNFFNWSFKTFLLDALQWRFSECSQSPLSGLECRSLGCSSSESRMSFIWAPYEFHMRLYEHHKLEESSWLFIQLGLPASNVLAACEIYIEPCWALYLLKRVCWECVESVVDTLRVDGQSHRRISFHIVTDSIIFVQKFSSFILPKSNLLRTDRCRFGKAPSYHR